MPQLLQPMVVKYFHDMPISGHLRHGAKFPTISIGPNYMKWFAGMSDTAAFVSVPNRRRKPKWGSTQQPGVL